MKQEIKLKRSAVIGENYTVVSLKNRLTPLAGDVIAVDEVNRLLEEAKYSRGGLNVVIVAS